MESNTVRVFYCDDDQDDQMLFREIERDSGKFELTLQSSGNELLLTLRKSEPLPDIIFLDLNMPRKNGIQVLREIRQMDKCQYVPVIVFSTSDSIDNIEKTRELGANLFITKPTSFMLMEKTIAHCVAIDWNKFKTTVNEYVYTAENKNDELYPI